MDIKLFPEILFQAGRHGKPVSAFRLWFIAKDFNPGGSGFIPAKAFRQHLHGLGVNRQTAMRWLEQALALGLLFKGGEVYRIASWQEGARIAGVRKLMGAVKVERKLFLAKGWLAICWAAYLQHFRSMIARQTLEELTGVPPRTQLEYERKTGVINQANYATYGKVLDNPGLAIRLFAQPGHYTCRGEMRRRLPNSRDCKQIEGISLANKGRLKHINRALDQVAGSPMTNVPILRLYCESPKQTKKALKKQKVWEGNPKERVGFIYEYALPKGRTAMQATKRIYNAIAL